MQKHILVLNFANVYAQLVAERVFHAGGKPMIVDPVAPLSNTHHVAGLILSGSLGDIPSVQPHLIDHKIFKLNVPVLGICLGAQLVAVMHHSHVGIRAEYGYVDVSMIVHVPLFKELNKTEVVWMFHRDSILTKPKRFMIIAKTHRCQIAGIKHETLPIYGVQFHPELSKCGSVIFKNFVNMCKESSLRRHKRIIKKCIGCEHHLVKDDNIKKVRSYCKKEGMWSRYTKCIKQAALEMFLKKKSK